MRRVNRSVFFSSGAFSKTPIWRFSAATAPFIGYPGYPQPPEETYSLGPANRTLSIQSTLASPRIMKPLIHTDELIAKLRNPNVPLSDHNLFLVNLAIEQDKDHKVLVPAFSCQDPQMITIAVLNMMMQGKVRKGAFNNAFALIENKEQYYARVELIIKILAELINNNPKIKMILLQEAPIGDGFYFMEECLKKYLPSHFELSLTGTEWGIMMIVDKKTFPNALEHLTVTKEGKMRDRLATIYLPELQASISTLHAPHGEPEVANELIIQNMSSFIEHAINQGYRTCTHFTFGDWNMNENAIKDIPVYALESVLPEGRFDVPLQCDSLISSSPQGHLDARGIRLDVDHMFATTLRFASDSSLQKAQDLIYRHKTSPIL